MKVSCSLYVAARRRIASVRASIVVCFMLLVCVRSVRRSLLLNGFLLRTQSSASGLLV